ARNRSELSAEFGADAEIVLLAALKDLIGCISAEQPGPGQRNLIANTESVLRIRGTDAGDRFTEWLHGRDLENELLIKIEEILQANRAAPGVGARIIKLRIASQSVGLEVDADVLQNARAIAVNQRLRIASADKEIGVWNQRAGQARDQAVLRNDDKAVVFYTVTEVRENPS